MISEARRRDYLKAMQVDTWLPRVALPFAAPSRPEMLTPAPTHEPVAELKAAVTTAALPGEGKPAPTATAAAKESVRPRIVVPEPKVTAVANPVNEAADVAATEPTPSVEPLPRFALQLLRAGPCLLLADLPTGEPFTARDPAYLLLKDILRAAGLPDSPQQVGDGEPIRWPLVRGPGVGLDQGPQAARDYVQGVVAVELEQQPSACLWLIGIPAVRFAGETDAEAFNRELNIEGLGVALAMPGLEALIEDPALKAPLWRAMQRSMGRWKRAE